jgi:hypothetical protein
VRAHIAEGRELIAQVSRLRSSTASPTAPMSWPATAGHPVGATRCRSRAESASHFES